MSRSSDRAKVAEWRQRFRRFSSSGLTVTKFCEKERVSTPTFYQWRKRLAKGSPRKSKAGKAGSFRRVTVVAASQAVSIQLAGGTRIEVCGKDIEAVRTVVGEVVRADHACRVGGVPC